VQEKYNYNNWQQGFFSAEKKRKEEFEKLPVNVGNGLLVQ
jgi:hypothetical protein